MIPSAWISANPFSYRLHRRRHCSIPQALFRVMLRVRPGADVENAKRDLLARMTALHDGNEDVAVILADAMISTFDDILRMLTLAIAGIVAVSLVVAGILVMNLMLISVRQRTAEIGLLKALGAPAAQVRTLFLAEAGLLAAAGVLLGSTVGYAATALLCLIYPEIPFQVPAWATLAAAAFALSSALLFAWLPPPGAPQRSSLCWLSAGVESCVLRMRWAGFCVRCGPVRHAPCSPPPAWPSESAL